MIQGRKLLLLVVGCVALSACSQKTLKPQPAPKKIPSVTDVSKVIEGVSFYSEAKQSDTTVPFKIAREESEYFHVPWFISASKTPLNHSNTEVIMVDPVNKTLSIGFDEGKSQLVKCRLDLSETSRADNGYNPCTSSLTVELPEKAEPKTSPSLFSRLFASAPAKTEEKVPSREVKQDAIRVAMIARQLNLFSRAEAFLNGDIAQADALDERNFFKRLQAIQRTHERKLDRLQDEIYGAYVKGAEGKLDIKRSVKDRSGYFGYDIDWDDNVSLAPVAYNKKTFDYSSFLKPLEGEPFSDAVRPLVSIVVDRIKQAYEADKAELTRAIAKQLSYYRVVCQQPMNSGHYLFEVSCPKTVSLKQKKLDVDYVIVSREFGVTLPSYAMANADLSLQSDAKTVMIVNNTKENLWIEQISLIGNDKNQSIYKNNSGGLGYMVRAGQKFELQLSSRLEEPLKSALTIPHITSRQAIREKMQFGYEIKYRVGDSKDSQNYQATQSYRLDQVLLGRM